LRSISEEQLLNISLLGAFLGVLFLIIDRSALAGAFAATGSGLLLGPIYPLCLAKILALANDSPHTKWLFGICGFGGALLPWLNRKGLDPPRIPECGLIIPLAVLALVTLFQMLATQRSSNLRSERVVIG
jgi:fucose permease